MRWINKNTSLICGAGDFKSYQPDAILSCNDSNRIQQGIKRGKPTVAHGIKYRSNDHNPIYVANQNQSDTAGNDTSPDINTLNHNKALNCPEVAEREEDDIDIIISKIREKYALQENYDKFREPKEPNFERNQQKSAPRLSTSSRQRRAFKTPIEKMASQVLLQANIAQFSKKQYHDSAQSITADRDFDTKNLCARKCEFQHAFSTTKIDRAAKGTSTALRSHSLSNPTHDHGRHFLCNTTKTKEVENIANFSDVNTTSDCNIPPNEAACSKTIKNKLCNGSGTLLYNSILAEKQFLLEQTILNKENMRDIRMKSSISMETNSKKQIMDVSACCLNDSALVAVLDTESPVSTEECRNGLCQKTEKDINKLFIITCSHCAASETNQSVNSPLGPWVATLDTVRFGVNENHKSLVLSPGMSLQSESESGCSTCDIDLSMLSPRSRLLWFSDMEDSRNETCASNMLKNIGVKKAERTKRRKFASGTQKKQKPLNRRSDNQECNQISQSNRNDIQNQPHAAKYPGSISCNIAKGSRPHRPSTSPGVRISMKQKYQMKEEKKLPSGDHRSYASINRQRRLVAKSSKLN